MVNMFIAIKFHCQNQPCLSDLFLLAAFSKHRVEMPYKQSAALIEPWQLRRWLHGTG